MKAEQLIRESNFSPARIEVIEEAFAQVWPLVEAQFLGRRTKERARLRLASIVLLIARVVSDVDFLKSASLRAFLNGEEYARFAARACGRGLDDPD
jgi:hypothetical protein